MVARGGHDTKSVARGQAQEFTAASELKENGFDGSARLRLENGGSKDFRFGATGSLHDFKVSKKNFKEPFRLPPMSVPLLGHAWINGELTLDFPTDEDWGNSDGPIAV